MSINKNSKEHKCKDDLPFRLYGQAIMRCDEEKGEFWVGNGEYSSRVNFCPFCGARAPKQVTDKI